MIIDMTAILFDGTTRARDLPYSAQKTLRFPRGASVVVRVSVVGENRMPVDLSDAETSANLTLRKSSLDGHAITLTGVKVPSEAKHRVDFTFVPDNTKSLAPGRYVYDVWLTRSSGRDSIVPMSVLILEPSLRAP